MFRKKQSKSIEINKLSSLVADNVEINGDLAFRRDCGWTARSVAISATRKAPRACWC